MSTRSYHRIERERRFLLESLPEPLTPDSPHERCTDHYLDGLRLRLRALVPSDGGEATYKLGQKHHPAGLADDERQMTTLYLTAVEHDQLVSRLTSGLTPIVKRRYRLVHDGLPYVIDVFEGACEGLVLADLELEDAGRLRSAAPPAFAIAEVTSDPRYEGGALARSGVPSASRRESDT